MKKYYIPGIISIVLLPLMCMWYFSYRGFFKEYGYYEIRRIDFGDVCLIEDNYSYYFDSITYKRYELSSDVAKNRELLSAAKVDLEKIFSLDDTSNGVKFVFKDDMNYESYIQVLSLLNYERGKKLMSLDSLWYVNDKYFEENLVMPVVENVELESITEFEVPVKESNLEILDEQIGNKKYLILGSFLLLVVFTFRDYIPIKKHREKK
ncbi:hypothetical protein HMPREF9713_00556 [Myroides odoratimimus CCUG 12700]|uniref:hypothetical protein n=1 Tax=Myroides odoratimimus TaxID=76832 RepID=UPI000353166F|nr:hypothetical protein [Myroides odoratimimus]EPH13609.1 hypothetical protein HMPREF9713_00556 [Myroides odoratimimus CCUG 12700]